MGTIYDQPRTPETSAICFLQYFDNLLKLHTLFEAGKGDTDEADEIREEMDAPWHGMTEEDQKRARDLSARLDRRDPSDKKDVIGKASVSISRRSGGKRGTSISISVQDEESLALVCDVEFTPEQFGNAVSGVVTGDIEFRWVRNELNKLGKIREHKTERIKIPDMLDRQTVKMNPAVLANIKHLTDEGWSPRWDDFSNHHRLSIQHGVRYANVSFVRWVKKESDDVQPRAPESP
jgi:hypothetical protein